MLFLCACHPDRLKDVDVSKVVIKPVNIMRLDRDVFLCAPDSFEKALPGMQQKYRGFYTDFIFNVINHGEEHDSVYKALKDFVQDADMKAVFTTTQQIYTDEQVKKITDQLNDAFKRLRFHIPQIELPERCVGFISGFNCSVATLDSTLGMSLDMYMGAENKFYKMLQLPRYKVRCMDSRYLVSDAIRGWLIHVYDNNEQLNNLLNQMIFNGKLYYALDAALPQVEDSIKIQYNTVQMNYCKKFQKNLWAYFTQQNRLFNSDLKEQAPFVSDGPFTSEISKDCPPRIAAYLGWQIVRAYMNKHPEVSVEQLMSKDSQLILNQSKYKP